MSSPRPTSVLSSQPLNYTKIDPESPKSSNPPKTSSTTTTTLGNENRSPAEHAHGPAHLNPCSTLSIAYPETSPREREALREHPAVSDRHVRSTTLPCQSQPIIANAVKRRRMNKSSSDQAGVRVQPIDAAQGHTTATTTLNSMSATPTTATDTSSDIPASPYASPVPHCRKRSRLHTDTATPEEILSPRVQCPSTDKTGRWQWIEEDPSDYVSGAEDDELDDDGDEDKKSDVEKEKSPTENHSAGLSPAQPIVQGGSPLRLSSTTTDQNQNQPPHHQPPSEHLAFDAPGETDIVPPIGCSADGKLDEPVCLNTKRINANSTPPPQDQTESDERQPGPPRPISIESSPKSPDSVQVLGDDLSSVPRASLSPLSRPVLHYHPSERQVTVDSQLEITRGTELLATEPAYAVLETGLLKTHCSGCMISIRAKAEMLGTSVQVTRQSFETCPTCKQCIFCDYCFEGRGLKHRMECKILAQPESGNLPSTECRLLMKLLMSDQSKLVDSPDFSPPWTQTITMDERAIVNELAKWWPTRNRKAFEAGEHGPIHDTRPTLTEQLKALRRMRTCKFPMYDSDCYLIGHGLYPDLARFNHDCDPNAQIVYPFDSMGKRFTRLIATRDIDNGEEITISYCDTGLPTHMREPLLSTYGFYGLKRHMCDFCDPSGVDPRWACYHDKCKARERGLLAMIQVQEGESVNPPPCTECGIRDYASPSAVPGMHPKEPIWTVSQLEANGQLASGLTARTTNGNDGSGSLLSDTPLLRDSMVRKETEPEVYLLFKYLEQIKTRLPKTVHPLPLIQRRAARLYAENRVMSLAICKIIIAHLHEALFAYDSISTAASSPISCAIYVTVLQTRVAQLSILAALRPLLPRLQQLRDTSVKGAMLSRDLRQLVGSTKGEAEEAEDMLNAVYRECKGDLWERYLKVKMDLEILLKIVDPKKR